MKRPKSSLLLLLLIISGLSFSSNGQVKITDMADLTLNPNSLLELESTNRGLLIPRVAIVSLSDAAPLTSPVPAGMLIYSTGGGVADGFYFWNGAGWSGLNGKETPVIKNTTSALLKTDSFILASGDITLTLPVVTAADNGTTITVKNSGSHLNLVTVVGNGEALIDGSTDVSLTHWNALTFTAWNGNWIIKNRTGAASNHFVVSETGSFRSIREVVEFLNLHMEAPSVIVLASEINLIDETLEINLPYPVTFESLSYGVATVGPGASLSGGPLFRCISECYFKMIIFDASTKAGFGSSPGEDAIYITGSGTYHEVKDCTIDGFFNGVSHMTDAELWLFECDITNSHGSGVLLNSPSPGSVVKISETDFTNNVISVNLLSGSYATVTLNTGFYTNQSDTDIAILYNPSTFSFENLIISGNAWNFIGKGIIGFDFSRSDGRDANAQIENNAGVKDEKPHCSIHMQDNTLTTTCTSANGWYRVNWINTSSVATNFVVTDNMIRYLPVKARDIHLIISGNVLVDHNNRVITLAIIKNGNTSTLYGKTALRVTTADQPFQFSTVIYIMDAKENDTFELYCSTTTGNDTLTFQDLNWYTSAQ